MPQTTPPITPPISIAILPLAKQIASPSGVVGTVWKILEIDISYTALSAEIVVAGYVDQASIDSGLEPLQRISFNTNGDDFLNFFDDSVLATQSLLTSAYAFINSQPFFN